MSYFDLRRFTAIPDLPSTIFFLYISDFRLYLLLFNLIIYPPTILPLFSKWRESTQGMAVLTRREVDGGVRAPLRFLSKVDLFPFFRSWFKRSKEGFDPHSEHFISTESRIDE